MSFSDERALIIAIILLKRQRPKNIQTLKDLLTFIPNPNHVKDILTTALIEVIYTNPQSALWLFQHPELLSEIPVRAIIAEELTSQALSWGYTAENFYFTADHTLEASESTQHALFAPQQIPVDESALALIRSLLMQ
ncbi:MAG: hypothetical protein RBJ76_15875 [Stenomitos frigidus ULC029]